ncbi:hypothetical protein ES703_77921 [subsurface metagenome]
MAGRVVTIEIDTTAIRLMESREGRVVKWASLSLEPTMVEEGVISDPLALGTAVRQLMTSSGIKAKDVVVSVSGLYSVNRIVSVSTLPGGMTTQDAALEVADEIMPLAGDRLYLSWQTVAISEDRQQVLVVGVPRDMIDAEVRALRSVGINPRIIDLKAIALARAVNREQALILNISPSSFDTVVVVNSMPEVMRSTTWQQEELAQEDVVDRLALNLELTVGFYNSHHPDTPLEPDTPLLITGQMSGDLALIEKLRARVGYPIEPLEPPLECPEHMPVSQYAVNIGLALKGTAPPKKLEEGSYMPLDMNLLPEVYRPWKPSARQIYFVCAVVAAIALLFPLYQLTSGAMDKTALLEANYNIINQELQRRQVEIKDREPIQKAVNEYNTIVNMGGGFTEDIGVINSLAEELGVEVQSITHEGESITVTCQTEPESYITFREYLTALEESGRFSTVTPPWEGFKYTTGGQIELETKTGS